MLSRSIATIPFPFGNCTGWPICSVKTSHWPSSSSSGSWWAATVATYCPGRMTEHLKSKPTGGFYHTDGSPCSDDRLSNINPDSVQRAKCGLSTIFANTSHALVHVSLSFHLPEWGSEPARTLMHRRGVKTPILWIRIQSLHHRDGSLSDKYQLSPSLSPAAHINYAILLQAHSRQMRVMRSPREVEPGIFGDPETQTAQWMINMKIHSLDGSGDSV